MFRRASIEVTVLCTMSKNVVVKRMNVVSLLLGLHLLCGPTANQQAHPRTVHGQPRVVHATKEARHHRGSTDEGASQGRATRQASRKVPAL